MFLSRWNIETYRKKKVEFYAQVDPIQINGNRSNSDFLPISIDELIFSRNSMEWKFCHF